MPSALGPITTTDSMISVEPSQRPIPDLPDLTSSFELLLPGTGGKVGISCSSERTGALLRVLFGANLSASRSRPAARDGFLIVDEAFDAEPSFDVDRRTGTVRISGPYATVAQLKVGIRFIVAWSLLTSEPDLVPMHGALIDLGYACVLISGTSRAGKSWFARELIRDGGTLVAEDWGLYHTGSKVLLGEHELPTVGRGIDRMPEWTPIELYRGDPDSPRSRFAIPDLELPAACGLAPTRVSHLVVLDDFSRDAVLISPGIPTGRFLREAEPSFTDEALSILGPDGADSLERRCDAFLDTLQTARLCGHRASATAFEQAASNILEWART